MSLIFFHQSRTTLCVAGGQLLTVKVSCLQDKISLLVLEPLMGYPMKYGHAFHSLSA
jgi:hypothetical protein